MINLTISIIKFTLGVRLQNLSKAGCIAATPVSGGFFVAVYNSTPSMVRRPLPVRMRACPLHVLNLLAAIVRYSKKSKETVNV